MSKINSINNKSSELTIDPGVSGDSALQFSINGTAEFKIGVDDTDSDKFKISVGGALGTDDVFVVTENGEITKPKQPAFNGEAFQTPGANATGDGTAFTVEYEEQFDQGGNFTSTTFTAPVSGKYWLGGFTWKNDLTSSHTSEELYIVTSNRTYRIFQNPWAQVQGGSDQGAFGFVSVLADMDASDTATMVDKVSGGTKVVDIGYNDGTTVRGGLTGFLVC